MIVTGTIPVTSRLRREGEVNLPGLRSLGSSTRHWNVGHGSQHAHRLSRNLIDLAGPKPLVLTLVRQSIDR